MRNSSKSSAPDFTSKEALLICKGHARFRLCLFYGISSIRAVLEK